jgi:type I restriction enzyme S subunit
VKLGSRAHRALASAFYGPFPDDWAVRKFKHLATIRNGQVNPEDPAYRDLPLFAPNHIESGTGRLLGVDSANEQGAESGKYLVEKGEIVYSKIRPALRKVTIAPYDGLCSADMYPVAPRRHIDARFLFFEMLSDGFSQYSLLESDRVAMPKINRASLGECPFVFPEVPRQRAIAAFLDRKTFALDALIAKKERLIELLEEKRQALITQAITKGHNIAARTRNSRSQWVGKIPVGWSATRLMYLTTAGRPIMYGIVLPGPDFQGGVPIVKSGDCRADRLVPERLSRTDPEIEARYVRSRLRAGDIVFAIRGSVGATAIVPPDLDGANLTQDAARIAPAEGILALPTLQWIKNGASDRAGVGQDEREWLRGSGICCGNHMLAS